MEGPEFPFGGIIDHGSGRLTDFSVGKDDGGRDDAGILVHLGDHAGSTGRVRWFLETGELGINVAGGVAHEAARFEPLEGGRAVPEALVVGVEAITGFVEANAARGADAGAGGSDRTIESVAVAPAAPRGFGAGPAGAGEAVDDPDVVVFVGIGAEVVFVVVAIDAPVLGDGFEAVGAAVTIGIGQLGDLGAGGGVEGAVLVKHAKGFVKAAGEEGPLDLREVFFVGAFADPDVPASGGDGDFFVGHDGDGAEFEDFTLGGGDFFAEVEFGLTLICDGSGHEEPGKEK